MRTCGIMIAKQNSNRFPDKNKILFEPNLNILIDSCKKENVYVFTNDLYIANTCVDLSVKNYWRGPNCIDDNQSYFEVLKYAYMSLPQSYDYIVTILANTINHDKNLSEKIDLAIHKMELNKEITLMRSFNGANMQSGVFIFRANNLPEKLYHEEMMYDSGVEIHYKEELG